jgi:hypothetical protein
LPLFVLAAACSRDDNARPVATPSVSAPALAPRGQGIDVTYRFAVAADAPPFAEDYTVFVHAYDAQGDRIWTDDHQPPVPTRRWKAGEVIEYTRPMMVRNNAEGGRVTLELGLYSTESRDRLPLQGTGSGRRSYRVASFDVVPGKKPTLFYLDGWHSLEILESAQGLEWRWSKRKATIGVRNPRRDSVLVLQLDQPVNIGPPQRVEVLAGDAVLDAFTLPVNQPTMRQIPVSAAQLGDDAVSRFTITVDRTFVPATLRELDSSDRRELGVRVFSVHVEPADAAVKTPIE